MKSQELKPNTYNLKTKPKVFVGLSGGVDSAVSATLLKKATPNNYEKLFGRPTPKGFRGFDVTGVFIKAWTPEGYPCTWKEDRRSAMRVAAILDIPFITLDLEKEYKKEVVDYMITEYKKGRTPNPDVMCNKEIKFGHFLKFALKERADFVATGHYARTSPPNSLSLPRRGRTTTSSISSSFASPESRRGRDGVRVRLMEGSDKNKDQSYFLWTLTQNQLKHTLFPIGDLQKDEVRKLAKKFGLPQATRKDSQGLCFLGKVDMKEFLSRYMAPKKGEVLNENGEVIGHHPGALFFTIGERHGFTITQKTTKDSPWYVVVKDIKKNTLTVAHNTRKKIANGKVWPSDSEEIRGLFQKQFFSGVSSVILKDVNWINPTSLKLRGTCKKILCRIRYRQEKVKCQVEKEGKKVKVIFDQPQVGVSAGQSLVLYEDEICLGGGIIA